MTFKAQEIHEQSQAWLEAQEEARRRIHFINWWSKQAFAKRQQDRIEQANKAREL